MIRFILGGERSGKSGYAESQFLNDPGPHLFIATGSPVDMAFRAQIARHKVLRPPELPVLECTHDLGHVLRMTLAQNPHRSILVDSLDFWYFHCCNQAVAERKPDLPAARLDQLLGVLEQAGDARITLVSCEIGLGPVPAGKETRDFVRGLGDAHIRIASVAQQVVFMVAGCPLAAKG